MVAALMHTFYRQDFFYLAVFEDAGAGKRRDGIVPEDGTIADGGERAVDQPLLAANLDTIAGGHVAGDDRQILAHGQSAPGERAARAPRIEIDPQGSKQVAAEGGLLEREVAGGSSQLGMAEFGPPFGQGQRYDAG